MATNTKTVTFYITKTAIRTINTSPQLHYLDINITNTKHIMTPTKALVDTGCAKTAISSQFFDAIKTHYDYVIEKQPHINIQTCDGTNHSIHGTVDIDIIVGKTAKLPIKINVLIIPNLADNFLLGLDFLASPAIDKITPTCLYMTTATDEILSEKFTTITFPVNELSTTEILEPMQTKHFRWSYSQTDKFSTAKCTQTKTGLMLLNAPSIEDGVISASITNISGQALNIPKKDNQIIGIRKLSFPKVIPEDEYLSLEEYNKSYENLEKLGYHQPSLTSYIEKQNAITELDLFEQPTFVTSEELLKQFETGHLNTQHKKMFEKIVLKNRSAFSTHKWDIGVTNMIEMDILVKTPELRIQKYIPIPLHTRDKVKDILDQFLNIGIIRHCTEPSKYCSNILVVPKKDKDSIRLLFDGRLLNYDTERLPMASISKAEILSQLAGKKHLSSLDFADAFYHIPLSKEAQPLTAFYAHTHALRMCFTRAPQGLKNSPLYLKMLLDMIFQDMTEEVLFYADDLLIATNGSLTDHLKTIEKVINKINKAGLKLRPAKLLLARTSLEFLGMIFERNTLSIPSLKLEAFRKLPSPNTPKRLKSAICAFAYYRHFVPNFSSISRELMELASKHPKEFKFTDVYEKQFRDLIQAICDNAKTYFPDPNLPFYVQTDASMYCAGGRLFQKDPQENECLIAAVSRTFTKTERNYTIYKKEALALMYTLRAFGFFLAYAPKVILLVDSKALTYIRLAKESSGILLRFSLELSKYEADIIHVPGIQNEISDLLSRQHLDIADIESEIASKRTLSEKDSITIMDALTLPDKFVLTKSELFALLNGPSPIDDSNTQKPKKSKAMEGKKNIKNTPITLNKRAIKMPRTTNSNRRPGVILPTLVTTRSKAKLESVIHDSLPRQHPGADDSAGPNHDEPIGRKSTHSGNEISPEVSDKDSHSFQYRPKRSAQRARSKRLTLPPLEDNDNIVPEPVEYRPDASDKAEIHGDSDTTPIIGGDAVAPHIMPDIGGSKCGSDIVLGENESYASQHYESLALHSETSTLGTFPVEALSRLQLQDELILELAQTDNTVIKKENNIFYKRVEEDYKVILPTTLIKFLINSHHYTSPGIHKSMTRIERDIKNIYYVPMDIKPFIREAISDCHICQLYNITRQKQTFTNLPRFKSPRLSWSIDLITDLPQSDNSKKLLLISVDDFSNYMVPYPMADATTHSLIEAIQHSIIIPFGCPQYIRSDEQPGLYNSKEFYKFLSSNNIDLLATAVASPFSNGRAESHIKIFKHSARKFFYQHKSIKKWDQNLHFIANAINQSVNTFNSSPEEIMFGYRIPREMELITFTNSSLDNADIIDQIMKRAEYIREKYEQKKQMKEQTNTTFKNKNSNTSKITLGDTVLHRQMQVSTGVSSKWKPLFTGPHIVNEIDKHQRTAICQHIVTGKTIKAHFNNLVLFRYDPATFALTHPTDNPINIDNPNDKNTIHG